MVRLRSGKQTESAIAPPSKTNIGADFSSAPSKSLPASYVPSDSPWLGADVLVPPSPEPREAGDPDVDSDASESHASDIDTPEVVEAALKETIEERTRPRGRTRFAWSRLLFLFVVLASAVLAWQYYVPNAIAEQ